MIKIKCPRCKESFNAPDAYAGKTAQCPTCKYQVTIPIPAPVQIPTNQTKPVGKKQCPKCREWISERATKCPHCHSRQPNPLRALAVILFIIGIVVFICVVGSQSDSSSTDNKLSDSSQTNAPDSASMEKHKRYNLRKTKNCLNRFGDTLKISDDRAVGVTFYFPAKHLDHKLEKNSDSLYFSPYIALGKDSYWSRLSVGYFGDDWVFVKRIIVMIDGRETTIRLGPTDVDTDVHTGFVSEQIDLYDQDKLIHAIAEGREVYVSVAGKHRRKSWKLDLRVLSDFKLISQCLNALDRD